MEYVSYEICIVNIVIVWNMYRMQYVSYEICIVIVWNNPLLKLTVEVVEYIMYFSMYLY